MPPKVPGKMGLQISRCLLLRPPYHLTTKNNKEIGPVGRKGLRCFCQDLKANTEYHNYTPQSMAQIV